MNISKQLKTIVLLSTSLAFLTVANIVAKKKEPPTIVISKQDSSFNLKNNYWNYVNYGQKRLLSSLYWIATILESDHEHYKQKDLNSWMFLRFKTISELEPMFYQNYKFSGIYLSIVKDDLEGASYMYDKGLSFYPDDYYLLSNAAFHYRFEVKDQEKAYPIFLKLSKNHKLPAALAGSFAKLEANNDPQNALLVIGETQKQFSQDNAIFQKLEEYKYALQAKMDLKCLNEKQPNCNRIDLEGKPYLFKEGKFEANKNIQEILKDKF